MSLDVSDPQNVSKVDQLEFEDRLDEYSWGRSLSGNDQRLYIAGPRYGSGVEPEGSIIQVVDIADASGDMKEGASLEVAGQINSRWQNGRIRGCAPCREPTAVVVDGNHWRPKSRPSRLNRQTS